MNPWISVLFLLAALLAGCASMSDSDCRSANWYALGERDALIYGLRPQIEVYAHQCSRHGVEPSEKDYLAGWLDGNFMRQLRMPDGAAAPPS
jgi:hypothetical protein